MRFHSMAIWLLAAAALAGCADKPPVDMLPVIDPQSGGRGAVGDAMEVDQLRKEYAACIGKLGANHASCQELRSMYEDARQHFDTDRDKNPR